MRDSYKKGDIILFYETTESYEEPRVESLFRVQNSFVINEIADRYIKNGGTGDHFSKYLEEKGYIEKIPYEAEYNDYLDEFKRAYKIKEECEGCKKRFELSLLFNYVWIGGYKLSEMPIKNEFILCEACIKIREKINDQITKD